MSEREKTYVEDVNRSIYDIRNEEKDRKNDEKPYWNKLHAQYSLLWNEGL